MILVLGDIIVDRYIYGEVTRISPEAPVPIFKQTLEKECFGGAANVAMNLHTLGKGVVCIGPDVFRSEFPEGLIYKKLYTAKRATIKTRYICGQQILRVDSEDTSPIPENIEQNIKYLLNEPWEAIVVSDYNKGMITPNVIRYILDKASELSIPTFVDPKQDNLGYYAGFKYITPNLKEATRALAYCSYGIGNLSYRIANSFNLPNVIVTKGDKGYEAFGYKETAFTEGPAENIQVADTIGAGDSFMAGLVVGILNGYGLIGACKFANKVASVACQHYGTYTVSRSEV